MRPVATLSLCLAAGAAAAAQRTSQPPIKVLLPTSYPPLGPAALSSPGCQISHVGQIELRPLPPNPPNVFHATLSVRMNGGTTWDLVTGVFDCDQPLFVKNNDVAHLNTPTLDEFAGSISRDRLVFVYQQGTVFRVASRSVASGPFGAGVAIAGVPAGAVHPKLAYDDGPVEKLCWAQASGRIVWATFTRGGSPSVGAPTVLVDDPLPLHSPEPFRDPAGIARALLLGYRVSASESHAYYASGKFNLPPAVSHELHAATGAYFQNGTTLGGTSIMAHGPAFQAPIKIDMIGTNCDQVDEGTTATICHFYPYKPVVNDVEFGTVALGRLASQPLQLPGFRGLLGLDPLGPLILLPPKLLAGYVGVDCWQVGVPFGTAGLQLATQAVHVRLMSGEVFLGNNSTLAVR